MVKNGYYGNGGLSLAWDLGVRFLGVQNCVICGVLTFFFFINLGFKDVMEKFVGCLPVNLF